MADHDLEVEIGLARPDELEAIWRLYQRVFLETYIDDETGITKAKLEDFLASDTPYLPKYWQKDLEAPSKLRTVYIARHRGEIVGMISPALIDDRPRLTALYIDSKVQGMGIGTRLMEQALSHFGNVDVSIGVASHLRQLPEFYKPFGFVVVDGGRPRQYPPDPMSYIEMMRPASTS